MAKRSYNEDKLQAAIVAYLRTIAPDCIVFAVPNGGARTPSEASKLKWTGVLAGVPDLILIDARQIIGLEVKTAEGRISPAQKALHEHWRGLGWTLAIVRCVEDVRMTLKACGVKTREVAA